MRVSHSLLISVLVSQSLFASSVENCPLLPEGSNLEWAYQEGPDFDVCYAVYLESKEMAFGIYLGGHPDFEPDENQVIEPGTVSTMEVTWYQMETENEYVVPARQTLLMINEEDEWFAHIWIILDSEKKLQSSLEVLKNITFKAW